MAISIKQMAAWAQGNSAHIDCRVYQELIACSTWDEVINSMVARDFLIFFQRRMNEFELGVDWRVIHNINLNKNSELTLEEEHRKKMALLCAERDKDDANMAADLKFNIYCRDNGHSNVMEHRKHSRDHQDEWTKAQRRLEDAHYEIEEHYKRLLKERTLTIAEMLREIPVFMENNTITHDCDGDAIEYPERCNPLDVNFSAIGFDEYR